MLKAIVLVDLNEFPSIFSKSAAFSLQTTENNLKPPQNQFTRGILKFNEIRPQEGALYITLWQNFGGHPENFSFMQFSQKIDGFRHKDSQGFQNSYNSLKPISEMFIFTIYQNYTLALMNMPKLMPWVVVYNTSIFVCLV